MSTQQSSNQQRTTTAVEMPEVPVIPGTEIVPAKAITKEIVPYSQVPASEKQELDAIIGEIDLKDRSSIVFFGSKAQEQMSSISENMLEGVRNKDLGGASSSLNEMVLAIKGFDVDELNPNKKQSFWARLFGKAKPVVAFLSKYDEVRKQIDDITDHMEQHKTQLLTDVISLDKLYEANLDYFHKLELYIAAGDEKLRMMNENEIPAMEQQAKADAENMLAAQALRDIRSARDDLERRIHDLRLTRQVAMQSLPSIRLVQENDKTLINKINSTLINTVPLWKNQLAQAVTIFRMSDAAETVKKATDLTNDLLESNATNLRTANKTVREQMERGVFDIESVRKANEELIGTINDSLEIAEEGRSKRVEAAKELQELEGNLRDALMAAKVKKEALDAAPSRS